MDEIDRLQAEMVAAHEAKRKAAYRAKRIQETIRALRLATRVERQRERERLAPAPLEPRHVVTASGLVAYPGAISLPWVSYLYGKAE